MSAKENIMVTLSEAEMEQLEKMSKTHGASKSRIISQALRMLEIELKRSNFGEFQGSGDKKMADD